jgi:hypothetical protein
VSSGWVHAALEAVDDDRPIAGGAVEPPETAGATAWTAYFCEYAQFMQPLPPGPARELPGNNLVFQRRLLEIGDRYTAPAFWKTYWCGELVAAGVPLTAEPALEVADAKNHRLGPFLLRRFRHGRCYGGMRGLGPVRRGVYAAGAAVLPLLMVARQLRAVWPRGRHRARLVAALPLVLAADVAWAAGEAVGYATGAGRACRHIV